MIVYGSEMLPEHCKFFLDVFTVFALHLLNLIFFIAVTLV